jgi:hypothetical protein
MNRGTEMTLDDLIGALPHFPASERLELAEETAEGFLYPGQKTDPLFVQPELAVKEDRGIVPNETSVILIEAPAAVGKSMLARELARRTGGSVWNLAESNVADNTFVGTVAQSFGYDRLGDVMTRLQRSDMFVILDALDETRLRSGDNNFVRFLEDICKLFKEKRSRPALVLLGRGMSAELASLYLMAHLEQEVAFAHLEIRFFGEEAAKDFIDRRLDFLFEKEKKSLLHRQNRSVFEEVRDTLFRQVSQLLTYQTAAEGISWADAAVRSFLGYAPVLVAISTFLKGEEGEDPQYHKLTNFLRKTHVGSGRSAVWRLFVQIVDAILEREQEKVRQRLEDRFGDRAKRLGWNKWECIYGPHEQRIRLLARNLKFQHGPLPQELHRDLRDEYEKAMKDQIEDHPFLGSDADGFAGLVFRDDTYAWMLASDSVGSEQKHGLRVRLTQKNYSFSPILSHSLLARSSGTGEAPIVEAADLGFIYESLTSETSSGENFWLNVYQDDADSKISASFTRQDEDEELIFTAMPSTEGILFPRRLTNVAVSVNSPVTLGTENLGLILGPGVNLECSHIRIAASNVIIRIEGPRGAKAPEDERQLLLLARSCEHKYEPLTVYGDRELLKIQWENPQYPWVEYQLPLPSEDELAGEHWLRTLTALRQLISAFSSDPGGRLTRAKSLVDGHILQNNPLRTALFNFLSRKKIIAESGGQYVLNREKIGEHGISLLHLRRGEATSQLRALLEKFFDTYPKYGPGDE